MRDQNTKFFRIVQLFLDLTILNGCFLLAGILRFDDLRVENPEYYNYYVLLWVFLNLIWFLMAMVLKLYHLSPTIEIRNAIGKAMNASFIQLVVLVLLLLSLREFYSRLFFLFFYFSFVPLLIFSRWAFVRWVRSYYHKESNRKPIILLGSNEESQQFYQLINDNPQYGFNIIAWFADDDGEQFSGGIEEAKPFLEDNVVSEIYCGLEPDDVRVQEWFKIADANLLRFRYLPRLALKNLANSSVELFGDVPVLISREEPLELRHNRILKRGFDILFSSLVFVFIASWLFPLLALMVKLSSRGPVFFKQKRSGINNAEFEVYKFRSMIINDNADKVQAVTDDPRITRIGKFMRKHNLDELPQFINVLKGQMSVVGPRPHMLAHTSEYRKLIDTFMVRHLIQPGITGLAQSQGLRGETQETESMEARVRADVYYLENWSVLLDTKIILVTIWNMIRGEKNAG